MQENILCYTYITKSATLGNNFEMRRLMRDSGAGDPDGWCWCCRYADCHWVRWDHGTDATQSTLCLHQNIWWESKSLRSRPRLCLGQWQGSAGEELAAKHEDLSSILGTNVEGANWFPRLSSDHHVWYLCIHKHTHTLIHTLTFTRE